MNNFKDRLTARHSVLTVIRDEQDNLTQKSELENQIGELESLMKMLETCSDLEAFRKKVVRRQMVIASLVDHSKNSTEQQYYRNRSQECLLVMGLLTQTLRVKKFDSKPVHAIM